MKKSLVSGAIIFTLLDAPLVFAKDANYIIKEMESLRDSLKLDDPARIDLTLRLADLYFDVSIQEGKGEELEELKKNRLKALDLYKHTLNGTDGLKKAEGIKRVKILFQMGRLLTRLDERKMAEPYYLELVANNETPKAILEQSALALAEYYEEEVQYAKSEKYYGLAIKECSDLNTCNYANYRLAWLFYKDSKLNEALATMEKSLWNKDGSVRENSLTDYIMFLSNADGDGVKELKKITEFAQKANRPELPRLLTEAFYVSGNRYAGSHLLAELNKKEPNIFYEVRLLEEFYGFRKWERVAEYLDILEKRSAAHIPNKPEEAKEVLAILRRFIVQVDAEMQMNDTLKPTLKRSIDVYLTLYPNDELRKKMQEGWLSAETNNKAKITKLEKWIKEDTQFGVDKNEIRKLRQTRLALAQKEKMDAVVLAEALSIAEILKGTKEADEFNYVAARTLYSEKKFNEALPLFQKVVASAKNSKELGEFSVLSQNLILDIYNQTKNFDGIVAEVRDWKAFTASLVLNEQMKKEDKALEEISNQALFEKAVSLKESKEALDIFTSFCLAGTYSEKACVNAKVLAVKFKDQEKLVAILEKTNDEESLMSEYELMGRFADAAKLKEKRDLNSSAGLDAYVKTALLYELDHAYTDRDRVLSKMMDNLKKAKSIPTENEKLVFITLDEAGLLDEKALLLPWSTSMKIKLASRLESVKPSDSARKLLLSQNESQGPIWSRAILADLEKQFTETNKIKFYGARSQALFKQRTNAIEKFVARAKPLLDGSDLETRVYILHMLKLTYKTIAQEILNSPIPEGLDEETLAQVAQKISEMADPFDRVNEDYDRLLQDQLNAFTDQALKEKVAKNISGSPVDYASFIFVPENLTKVASLANRDETSQFYQNLRTNPEDRASLSSLQALYKSKNNARLEAYFSGRLELLKEEGKTYEK